MPAPIKTLNSQVHYAADGGTLLWDFSFNGGYLDRAHVQAYVEDNSTQVRTPLVIAANSFISSSRLRISPAVAAGKTLVIYRKTPSGLPLVDWQLSVGIDRDDLETSAKQAVFLATEAVDSGYASVTDVLAILAGAQSAQTAAATSATASAGSATSAGTSAVNAAASAASAATSATSAGTALTTLNGYTLETQYSVDGSTAWHTTFTIADKYMRVRFGSTAAWGAAVRIGGIDGSAGPAGPTGAAGTSGTNVAQLFLYKRSATTPVRPTNAVTYTFATDTLGAPNNGWVRSVPSGIDACWVIAANALSTSGTDTIAAAEWSTPVQLVKDGFSNAAITLYQRTADGVTAPALPTASLIYTFATGAITGSIGSWSRSIPTTGTGDYVWTTQASAVSTDVSDTIAPGEWAAPVVALANGNAASILRLKASAQTLTFDSQGVASPPAQTITLTAELINLTGTATFACTLYNAAGGVVSTVTLGGTGNTRTLTSAQFGTVAAYAVVTITHAASGLSDVETLVKLKDGSGAIVVDLSNQAAAVAANNGGTVTAGDLATLTTDVNVYIGLVNDTGNWSFTLSPFPAGVTASLSTNVVTVTAFPAGVSTGGVDIICTRAGFPTITKTFSFSKSKTGAAGSAAQSTVWDNDNYIRGLTSTSGWIGAYVFNTNGDLELWYSANAGSTWTKDSTRGRWVNGTAGAMAGYAFGVARYSETYMKRTTGGTPITSYYPQTNESQFLLTGSPPAGIATVPGAYGAVPRLYFVTLGTTGLGGESLTFFNSYFTGSLVTTDVGTGVLLNHFAYSVTLGST